MRIDTVFGRALRDGLSSLRDRAANLRRRLAALRFNPSRGRVCGCRWCSYDRVFEKHIRWVLPWDRLFFEQLKEDWESAEHEGHRLERMLADEE